MSINPQMPEAGSEHSEQHRGTESRYVTEDSVAEEFLPDGGVIDEVPVDVAEVNPDLANPELVAELVAPDRTIRTEVGGSLLQMDAVTVRFGGLTALDAVSFEIKRGEILGLIGPNGAGKTTLLNVLSGFVSPVTGNVYLDGVPLRRLSPQRRVALGLRRTFQQEQVVDELTARENLQAMADHVSAGAREGDSAVYG